LYQQERLEKLLRHVRRTVPFYRGLPEGGLDTFPVVTKQDLRTRPAQFISSGAAAYRPAARSSSGTTGQPFSYLLSREARSSQWACMYHQWSIGGWTPGDRIVYLGGTAAGPSLHAARRRLYERLNNWVAISAFAMTPDNMDRWLSVIRRQDVRFMHAYPSSAHVLASHARRKGVRHTFTAIITSAEMLHAHQRQILEETFSCPVYDLYGANDGGAFAFQCEERRGYHLVLQRAIVEILRADGTPAAPGERGRVVATDLLNQAMAFIRYDAGDEAALSADPCPCGRSQPLLHSISGRSNDYIRTPSGERIHGGFFSYLVRGSSWVDQFQVVQESPDRIVMLLKVWTEPPAGALALLQEQLGRKCAGMEVLLRRVDDIPPAPNGKYQYIVNRIP
jgi:phenylacetate-CoA ligase